MKEAGRMEDQDRCQNRSITLPALRQLRQAAGLSQRELGRLAKVSPGTVYRLENSARGAYPSTMQKLAHALEVSPSELVREHRLSE